MFLISLRILTASRDITLSLILEPFYSSPDKRDKLVQWSKNMKMIGGAELRGHYVVFIFLFLMLVNCEI